MQSPIINDYTKYKVIWIWLKDCKGFNTEEKEIDQSTFIKEMQTNSFICIECNEAKIVLCSSVSNIESSVESFRSMFRSIGVRELKQGNKIPKLSERKKIIVITKSPFTTNVSKMYKEFRHISIINYKHMDFACDKRKGPMCHPHKVMNEEEKDKLFGFDRMRQESYAKVCITDPQIIWSNAKVGDMVMVTRPENTTAGESVTYKLVTSRKFVMESGTKLETTDAEEET